VIVRDKTTLEMHTTNADAMVNGEEITLDTPPLVIQGRTMVPFRWIGEQLGAKVAFSMSEETRKVDTVSYQIGKQTITLCIGSTDATSTIDRETMPCKLDVAPFIKDGRTLVPLRFVSEILGADVSWTPPNTIGIVYPKEIPVRENECVSFWTDIDQADLQKMIEEKKEFTLIDARDQGSYNDGHIPGAINIHVDMLPDEFEKATPETENMEIVVYCKSGRFSKQASEWLVNQGYKNVQSLTGGFASWKGETEKTEE
jgi:rhodanese-related sulfurtransferase